MRKIAICDDHIKITEFIGNVCEEFYLNKQGVDLYCFHNGKDLVNCGKHFDVIFMDVELGSLSGVDVANKIRETDLDVLFIMISAHEKYKMDVCSLHVLDFLNKPFRKENVIAVLERVEKYCEHKKEHTFISFRMKEEQATFDTEDIYYLEYSGRKIKIITRNDIYEFYGNIGDQAKRMKSYGFGVPHAAFVVNFKHVKAIRSKELILNTQAILPVSRYKVKEFRNDYAMFLKNQSRKWGCSF